MARTRATRRPFVRGYKTDMSVLMKRKAQKKKTKAKGKKLYTFRPGTVAEREVKKLQKSTKALIRKEEFKRLSAEVTQDFAAHIRQRPAAISALQELAEDHLVNTFGAARTCTALRKRKGLECRDMSLARNLKPNKMKT